MVNKLKTRSSVIIKAQFFPLYHKWLSYQILGKERSNQSTNNGDMADIAKRPVSE